MRFSREPDEHRHEETDPGVIAEPDSLWINGFPIVPNNAIGVSITVTANANSPKPFPLLPIYFSVTGAPFPGSVFTTNNQVNIPPDGGLGIADLLNSETLFGFNYGVSNVTSQPISFDLTTTIITTNAVGNGGLVLSNLDNTLGPYYRFESGTSMAAADVSGLLALLQDFFTNTLHATPSPALLKALLINGARPTGAYNLQVNNSINYEGWGLVNLPNSLPANRPASFNGATPSAIYFQDQSPTNALATGDRHTFLVSVQTNTVELRVTLVWTDPPGNPAAAIKLVNQLELVVTNLDSPTNPVIYYGNDIPAGYIFNTPEGPTNAVVPDAINNVQNVIIPPYLGTNYSITVIGRGVNVNAVSAQTNSYNNANPAGVFAPNVAQDYALVVSSADGGVPGAFTVADQGIVSNPTGDQDLTFVTQTNQPLLNQFVGASSPLLGTNTVALGGDTMWSSNGAVVLGETNQWHFYVVTNNGVMSSNGTVAAAPYAGFVTFLPPTLSVPRMGVFADTVANATRPEADIDLYVTTDATLTNLNPAAVASCLAGTVVPGSVFNGASLSRGGTEYVVDTNSAAGEVYYIGVKSEDQLGSEYDFFPVFSRNPFSSLDANGDEYVSGIPVPVNIPDGTPADPGMNFVLGLAIYPIEVENIIVTNVITHQNFGDLYGTLTHNGSATGGAAVAVLNNHDALGSVTNGVFVYDDSGNNPGALPSDGPGSLQNFSGQDGSGAWRLTEVDDALTQTGSVQNFTMFIKKRIPLGHGGETNALAGQQWFDDFVDVPAGATNLILSVTNLTTGALLPLDVFVKLGAQPTTNDYDKMAVVPTTPPPPSPGISITIGPTDVPPLQPGRYWIGVFNPNAAGSATQTFSLFAAILPANPVGTTADFAATGSTPLLDDAVTNADLFITNPLPVVSVNVGIEVQDPRLSDLVFYLISPDGTRVLLMENRGGADTNGAGATVVVTNVTLLPTNTTVLVTNVEVYSNNLEGLTAADYLAGQTVGGWTVTTNQVSLVTDPANAYPGSNYLALASGGIAYTFPPPVTGGVYTLTLACRGPGIAGWWRGENNANDSINGNNGTVTTGSVTYTSAEVEQGFSFDGGVNRIEVPFTSTLNFGPNADFSIDGWISPLMPPPSLTTGIMSFVDNRYSLNSSFTQGYEFGLQNGILYFHMSDSIAGDGKAWFSTGPDLRDGNMHYVTVSVKRNSVTGGHIYIDGAQALQFNPTVVPGNLTPSPAQPLRIGNHALSSYYSYFKGRIDEVSIYRRALSTSEIQAIYNLGASGKYDPIVFNTSPSQSLAEAQISLNGSNLPAFYGNNTSWQTYTASGAVATNGTVLTIAGLEPGMLLGSLMLTNIDITTNLMVSYLAVTNVVTNTLYLTFTEDTNLTTTPIKFAVPPFVPAITTPTNLFTNSFEGLTAADYVANQTVAGWAVASNQVSLVTDPANAYDGSNFLALASGAILTNLPTVAGQTYTLTFTYRGPGITGMWRAENNFDDSIFGNNASTVQNVFFTNGVVGAAFSFDPEIYGTVHLSIQDQPIYQLTNELSIEGWIRPRGNGWTIFWRGDDRPGLDPYLLGMQANNIISFGVTDQANNGASISAPLAYNQWWHIAATFNSGAMKLYTNGVLAAQASTAVRPFGSLQAGQNPVVSIGNIGNAGGGFPYIGDVDEISLYSRDLSASEAKAIYKTGGSGKFDPASSFPQNLAEAQINLGSETPATILGNNTNWQTETITFTATQNGTPLQITGIEPGMLLDDFVLTTVPGNLYYLPEQSLDAFTGAGGYGDWQLEIQDDRAGAYDSNSPPVLVSWDLQFVFADTNAIPVVIPGGIGQTNQFVPAGGIAWYQINVPADANYAANHLLSASAPVNVWFDTNNPPATNILLMSGTSGAVLMSTTNAATPQPAPNIYDGGTYYLGVQNPNAFTVNYGIEVDFDHGNATNSSVSLIIGGVTAVGGGTTLQWTALPGAQFQVQWTDDLAEPWKTDPAVITSSDGNFTFTDDGSQTAPPGAARFYRLVQISP